MERFNPFASTAAPDELDPFGTSLNRSTDTALSSLGSTAGVRPDQFVASRTVSLAADRSDSTSSGSSSRHNAAGLNPTSTTTTPQGVPLTPKTAARYTTSFPDPFGETIAQSESPNDTTEPNIRSSSVTFANSVEEPIGSTTTTGPAQSSGRTRPSRGQAGGLSSFLSRATSVTSSSVTEAVGSVRSAVDSISSQIQQAVPSNINERLSSTATNLMGSVSGQDQDQQLTQQQQQQQSATSYLASKFSSATNQFSSSSNQGSNSMPMISRQRVVLIIDSYSNTDWAQQFINYRRVMAGLQPIGAQSALSNFFTSATAQLTSGGSSGSSAYGGEGSDLVEQADFRDISVLANQSSSTAIVLLNPSSNSTTNNGLSSSALSNSRQELPRNLITASGARIIRPEYVVIRQRISCLGKGDALSDHLRGIVTAFNYCLVPMFEPLEVWQTFQDKQLVFARLLRIQKQLGKENFPLIPQVFCQTHQDLTNHINSSQVSLPCLIRTGPLGKGRMRADNLQMLKDFASIVEISGLSCTVEPHLDVKCDLIVQKLGSSLKLFKSNADAGRDGGNYGLSDMSNRQSATRQTSLGVLSSLIPNTSQQQQQNSNSNRRSSNPGLAFEKLTEMVNVRYKNWVDAVGREFDNKLEAFCLKIVITNQDREYIVGLSDGSMEFLGAPDNQDEDRRSFVELIINKMDAILPKHSLSREPSANLTPTPSSVGGGFAATASSTGQPIETIRRSSSDDKAALVAQSTSSGGGFNRANLELNGPLGDRKKFQSQTQINGVNSRANRGSAARTYGQLSSRSQSVSVNQSDYLDDPPMVKSSYFTRRGSERSDSNANDVTDDGSLRGSSQQISSSVATDSTASGLHQRQASLGQSFLDQTSTAFSSLQKQSMSFFKRLDSARGAGDMPSSTPPMSAKSDKGFDRSFAPTNNNYSSSTIDSMRTEQVGGSSKRNDFKSQSVDCSGGLASNNQNQSTFRHSVRGKRDTPPKPPPPSLPGSRQSSLASYSNHRAPSCTSMPHSTPSQTRQNTATSELMDANSSSESTSSQRTRVVRQNSALSAFEPFDPELRKSSQQAANNQNKDSSTAADADRQHRGVPIASSISQSIDPGTVHTSVLDGRQANKSLESGATILKRGSQFDSASITSGDSNSTSETTTAEDTMNNLKKTFASIFGDKCE